MNRKKLFVIFICVFNTICLLKNVFADNEPKEIVRAYSYEKKSLIYPRAFLEGVFGDNNSGKIDVMLPVFYAGGRLVYFDTAAHYQDKSGNLSFSNGLGFRLILTPEAIFGAYLFADYNSYKDNIFSASSHRDFWVLNSGLEVLGSVWDFAVNGYFPVSRKRWLLRDGWADQFGVFQYERFQKHAMYNKRLQEYATLGTGFDVAIGSVMPAMSRLKAYLGAYYFEENEKSGLTGIFGRLVFAFNEHIEILMDDTYDKEMRNTFALGLRLTLGGIKKKAELHGLEKRMLDPIGHGWLKQNYGLSVPITKSRQTYSISDSGFDLELDNIQFIKSDINRDTYDLLNTVRDGTFEHPYIADDFTQNKIDASKEKANFFIAGKGNLDIMPQITLLKGQSIYGRSSDFIRPAQDLERPKFIGSIKLSGENRLDSLQLENKNKIQQTAIVIDGLKGDNVYIDNVMIGNENDAAGCYSIGIDVKDFGLLDIRNSQIFAHNGWNADFAYGIKAKNSSLNIVDTKVKSKSAVEGYDAQSSESFAIFADHAMLNIDDSMIEAEASSITLQDGSSVATAYGIYAQNSSQVNMTAQVFGRTKISGYGRAEAKGDGTVAGIGAGIYADDSVVTIKASVLNGVGEGIAFGESSLGSGFGYGIYAKANSSVDIAQQSAISGSGLGNLNAVYNFGSGFGVRLENSYLQIADSTINAISDHDAYGIYCAESEEGAASTLNVIDTNNLFKVQNIAEEGDAFGIYVVGYKSHVLGDYQNNNYEISGGSRSGKWYPASLPADN